MAFVEVHPRGFIIKVYIQPRSAKNQIIGIHGDALKIRLTAAPVDDAANKMCISILSKTLHVPKSSLEIVAGRSNRTKRILFNDMKNDVPGESAEEQCRMIASRLVEC